MILRDFKRTIEIRDDDDLHAALRARYVCDNKPSNSYWMDFGNDFPAMAIFVCGENACAIFMPGNDGRYLASHGATTKGAGESMIFYFDEEPQQIPMNQVISVVEAESAAAEFLHTQTVPSCINWIKVWEER